MQGSNINSRVSLLSYYFISVLVLVTAGVIYKLIFVTYNHAQFSSLSISQIVYALLWGMRFDLASAAFFSLISCIILWLFYHLEKFKKAPVKNHAAGLLATMLLLQMSLQIADILYFSESGRHVSYEVRDVLIDASGLLMTAIANHTGFIVLSYLLASGSVFLVLRLGRNIFSTPFCAAATNDSVLSKLKHGYGIKLFAILLISVVFIRGVEGIPQSVISAFKIGDAKQAVVTMNGAYSIVYGVLNSSKEVKQVAIALPDDIDTEAILNSLYPESRVFDPVIDAQVKKYNLIFILMEGWPADFMSSYGYEFDTTPFYTEIKAKSLAPLGVIAGGVRTSEGIYTTFCSQQNPLGKTIAQTSLQNNSYDCLPSILKRHGWHTAFFQGTHKETSGTGAFAQSLGFTDSFAKEDMPEGRYQHNYWGVHDPDIYDYLLARLDEMPQPFLVGVNTNSTHDIKIPDGAEAYFGMANSLQKHQSVLRFSDQAMRAFFARIEQKPYYKNTIFVLMSDHTHDQHDSLAAKYFIPGVIFSENLVPARTVERYVSQRDFSPTIMQMLGLPASPTFTGKSFWTDNDDVYFADYFDSGSVGWINGDILVETGVNDFSVLKCFSIENGLLNAAAVDCDERHKKSSIRSLVFTSYSQSLLFKGKTKMFYEFLDK